MPKLFHITGDYQIKQYHTVMKVLKRHLGDVSVVYQSNYYMIIACLDQDTARTVVAQLTRAHDWYTETREGRKNKVRHYIKLTFNKE